MTKRIGLIIPSVNTVIEDDLRRFCPAGIAAHFTRVRLNASSEAALRQVVEEVPDAASRLHDAGVDALALACTGASMLAGDAGDWLARLAGPRGVPVATTMVALNAAFAALGTRCVALFSPFEDWFNKKEARMLEEMGLKVASSNGLGIRDPRDCAVLTPAAIVEGGRLADSTAADTIFLSCANIRGLEAVEALETLTGKPVVTSNQVVLWWLLRALGADMPVKAGRLLAGQIMEEYHG